ncbi:uncharacterized protein JCM15063_003977 [Sporobolomyces koalae]|uniref:uncharacterized protein n=1 Tax=Sporobolomyces koalae TaxID=500713 RepID=UPI003182AE8C
MVAGRDKALPTPDQVRPALHMLAVSVPLMSAVLGACLRVSLSYHQLFHRLDPFLFRLLVGILLGLTMGQVACITAETWYILRTIMEGQENLKLTLTHSSFPAVVSIHRQSQKAINACTQVCTTAIALLGQAFYVERLFYTTKSIVVRAISILLWMLSISLFIAWNVKYLLHNGPHLNGDRKYNLGAASLWALASATSWVSISLIYFARKRRQRSSKTSVPLTRASQLFQILSLSIQTFSLLALNHLASAIGFTASLATSSNSAAACVAFFFFNLFPGLSTYSIVYTLNQRNIAVMKRSAANAERRRGDRDRRQSGPTVDEKGKRRASRSVLDPTRDCERNMTGTIGTTTGMSAEDDPSNWRGDVSVTNSINGVAPSLAGTGLGVSSLRNSLAGATLDPRSAVGKSELEVEPDLVVREEPEPDRKCYLDNFDRFDSDDDDDRDRDEDPDHDDDDGHDTGEIEDGDHRNVPPVLYTWGIVPSPIRKPAPAAFTSQSFESRIGTVGPDSRTRGASVQIDEVGLDMNWDALDTCDRPRLGPNP